MSTTGIVATVVAGGATIVGAAGIYLIPRPGRRGMDAMLGAAAGVMLAAVSFSLLVPAFEGQDGWGAAWLALAFVLGALVTWGLQWVMPEEPALTGGEGVDPAVARRTMLLIAAVALHNIPEGLAVGVGVGFDPEGSGLALAGGILVQNLPEGLAVAVAAAALGTSRARAFWLSSLTGVVEIVAGLVGFALAGAAGVGLPTLLAAAAGAMLFVVSHEIVPETHRHGFENTATSGLVLGFAGMILLDALLA